jgi:hypothetical protein
MPIDNNILERDIRVFATRRKSWLFSDSVEGVKASAVIYSLVLTCRACGVDPLAWLRHVLNELPQRALDVGMTTSCRLPSPPTVANVNAFQARLSLTRFGCTSGFH